MSKIKVKNPIVEIDGDEMTRIIWRMVKEHLLLPYVEMQTVYYDLSIEYRDATDDKVTVDAARAIDEYGVGVKCATITPNQDRVKEYHLKQAWPSPNGTIRGILDGTVFRKPIMLKNIPPTVRTWKKPIVIGRHAYGDVYKNQELKIPGPGRAEIVFTPFDGSDVIHKPIHVFHGPGVIQGIHSTEKSIRSFARACIQYAINAKLPIWFAAKDTISKTYHAYFRDIFQEEVDAHKEELKRYHRELARLAALPEGVHQQGAPFWSLLEGSGGEDSAIRQFDDDLRRDLYAEALRDLVVRWTQDTLRQGE